MNMVLPSDLLNRYECNEPLTLLALRDWGWLITLVHSSKPLLSMEC